MADLAALIQHLRELTGGVPVGVKLAAGKRFERDLSLAVEAGPDFITVGGSQGGTWGAAPAVEDDFGLPTLFALSRAARFFRREGLRGRISLVVEGKLRNPGEFLKALALGADAVSIGTVALMAAVHTQALKVLPWEPPTELLRYTGRLVQRFDVEQGAASLARFLQSCREEMAEGLRALGKASHRELSPDDLMALDPLTAEICGVEPACRPVREGKNRWTISARRVAPPKPQPPWLRPPRRPKPLMD